MKQKKYIEVSSKSYGNNLKGTKVYYEGKRPKKLKDDGSFSFGKSILELLKNKFGSRFRLVLTKSTDSVKKEGTISVVRLSEKTLGKMYGESFSRRRDINIDIIQKMFGKSHPKLVDRKIKVLYTPGRFAGLLEGDVLGKLSSDDKDALNKFIPEYVALEPAAAANKLSAKAQLKTLKQFAKDLRKELLANRSEHWWQDYIRKNILVIQQGYIRAIDKINVAVGKTKFPDFSLVTHDGYLDVLEIKKPSTPLLDFDEGRSNFYWNREISRALIQVENYIESISRYADAVRSFLLDDHQVSLQVLRPRGVILAGSSAQLGDQQKKKDDFRILSCSMKNVQVITYDELLDRLENYIDVLDNRSEKSKRKKRKNS